MKCMMSMWLTVMCVVCCHLQVTSGSDVFLVKAVSSQRVCDRLCVYTSRCEGYRWDAATRTCHLLSTQPSSTDSGYLKAKSHNGQCGHHPCAPTETCVPVEAATAYICLETTLPTSSSAAPSTSTITSVPAGTTTTNTTPSVTTTSVPSSATTTKTTPSPTTLTTKTASPGTTPSTSTTTSVPAVTSAISMTTFTSATTPVSTTTATTFNASPSTATTTTTSATTSTTTPTTISITTPTTSRSTTTMVATTTTPGPVYRGCYQDDRNRVLPSEYMPLHALTIDMCRIHCTKNGYSFFGLQFGVECFCGNMIKSGYSKVPDNDCNYRCAGDNIRMCGGYWRISIYQATSDNARIHLTSLEAQEKITSAQETTTLTQSPTITASCVSDCTGLGDGTYQSCERCNGYVECDHGRTYNRPCPTGTRWDDNTKLCLRPPSPTCVPHA